MVTNNAINTLNLKDVLNQSANSLSTGILTGGVLTINSGDNTLFDLTSGTGSIIDNYTDPNLPTLTMVEFDGGIGLSVDDVATEDITFVSIDITGNIIQSSAGFDPEIRRDFITLGTLNHVNNTFIESSSSAYHFSPDIGSQLVDMARAIGVINRFGNIFEPNGVISSSVINLAKAKIVPGRVTRNPARAGGEGVYKPGQWFVHYSPETRELSVEVVIDFFHQDIGAAAIEGNSTDILSGTVSKDGELWLADWFTLARYVAYVPEPNEFENMTEPRFRGLLIFEKVKE